MSLYWQPEKLAKKARSYDLGLQRRMGSIGKQDRLFGFVGRQKRGEGNLLIQRWLLANLPRRRGEGVLNLKDLLAVSPPSDARPFRSCRPLKRAAAYLLVRGGLLAKSRRRTGEALLNLKGLLALLPPNCRAAFTGFVVLLRRCEADLLIPQGLLAKSLRRTGESAAQSKGLANDVSVEPEALV